MQWRHPALRTIPREFHFFWCCYPCHTGYDCNAPAQPVASACKLLCLSRHHVQLSFSRVWVTEFLAQMIACVPCTRYFCHLSSNVCLFGLHYFICKSCHEGFSDTSRLLLVIFLPSSAALHFAFLWNQIYTYKLWCESEDLSFVYCHL